MDFKPVDGRLVPRYSGVATFLRLPLHTVVEDLDVALLGVPWDGGVTYRPAARLGPRALREASTFDVELGGATAGPGSVRKPIFEALRIADAGDVAVVPGDWSATSRNIGATIERVARS